MLFGGLDHLHSETLRVSDRPPDQTQLQRCEPRVSVLGSSEQQYRHPDPRSAPKGSFAKESIRPLPHLESARTGSARASHTKPRLSESPRLQKRLWPFGIERSHSPQHHKSHEKLVLKQKREEMPRRSFTMSSKPSGDSCTRTRPQVS